jgi:hypothetical protein
MADDEESAETVEISPDEAPAEEALVADEEFEGLRRKSARASSIYEDMDEGVVVAPAGRGRFSPTQRLILALLVLLNVLACGFALLVLTDRLSLF